MYDAEIDPDFWVPPVIGPWAFKKKLRNSAEVIGWRIEYLLESGKSLDDFGVKNSAGATNVSNSGVDHSASATNVNDSR